MTTPPAGSQMITFADEEMALLPSRAIWWPSRASVVLADMHFGKAASFRMHGIPVPSGSTSRDLTRVSELLRETAATRLVILGDFLHARAGRQPEVHDEMTRWREAHSRVEILLIRGNHDRSAGHVLPEWNITEVEEPHVEQNIAMIHDPAMETDLPALAGHIHPVTAVRDFDGSTVNIPSFIHDPDRLILPSFGTFTGGYKMRPQPGRRMFLAMAGRVIARKA